MKKLLCKLFGHQPPVYEKPGWYSPGEEYAHIREHSLVTDGIGREHVEVMSECPRCRQEFKLCRLHLPENMWRIKYAQAKVKIAALRLQLALAEKQYNDPPSPT